MPSPSLADSRLTFREAASGGKCTMITRIQGVLVSMTDDGRALLRCDHIVYELFVPGADQQRLATITGQQVEFHTLHYMENRDQGSVYMPRLIGFSSPEDRSFFELFTTVKGIGNRKALRALQLPFGTIATAIADRDIDLLKSLPEIGKRTAETIVAELHGKVNRFIELKPQSSDAPASAKSSLVNDAVAILTQLGEQRLIARQLVERALTADPTMDSADVVVAAAFRLKEMR